MSTLSDEIEETKYDVIPPFRTRGRFGRKSESPLEVVPYYTPSPSLQDTLRDGFCGGLIRVVCYVVVRPVNTGRNPYPQIFWQVELSLHLWSFRSRNMIELGSRSNSTYPLTAERNLDSNTYDIIKVSRWYCFMVFGPSIWLFLHNRVLRPPILKFQLHNPFNQGRLPFSRGTESRSRTVDSMGNRTSMQ